MKRFLLSALIALAIGGGLGAGLNKSRANLFFTPTTPGGGGGNPFALVSHTAGVGLNGVTTSTINTTGANLLVVTLASYFHGTGIGLTDSKGNTWVQAVTTTTNADQVSTIYYAYSPVVGSGHTVTCTGSGVYCSVTFSAWSGATGSVVDQTNANGVEPVATTVQPGSVTATSNNELIITSFVYSAGTYTSVGSGFTVTDTTTYDVADHYGSGQAYLLQTTAAALNPTWTWSTSSRGTATIATFK